MKYDLIWDATLLLIGTGIGLALSEWAPRAVP
jgi:hypothetical protein